MGEAESQTKLIRLVNYLGIVDQNRRVFILNFGSNFKQFDVLLQELQATWVQVARRRDFEGKSHLGLLLPSMILMNHLLFGFERLASFQSALAWPTFRPGLEALLFMGKWADDPKVVEIWKDRRKDLTRYMRLFSGRGLVSRSLPRSDEFREVLGHLNDEYLHPNADFSYGRTDLRRASTETLVQEYPVFDKEAQLHEAHLLAFLNLMELICASSASLVAKLLDGSDKSNDRAARDLNRDRAVVLAKDERAAKILTELGLWKF